MSRKDEPANAKPEDWVRVQAIIHQLYVVEQKPLREVKDILEEKYNFRATQRMYKSRIQNWKYDKKFKESEWRQIIAIWKMRRDAGKDSVFKVRGRTITSAKIRKFLKRKKTDDAEFLAQGVAEPELSSSSSSIPDIVCNTPPGSPAFGGRESGSDASDAEDEPGSVPEVSRHSSAVWVEADGRHPSFSGATYRTDSIPSLTSSHMSPSSILPFPSHDVSSAFGPPSEASASSSSQRLVFGVDGLAVRTLNPDTVKLDDHDDRILSGLLHSTRPRKLSGQSRHSSIASPSGPPSPTFATLEAGDIKIERSGSDGPHSQLQEIYLTDEDMLASRWLAHLFRACIFHKQKQRALCDQYEESAAVYFKQMVERRNRFLLPGLGILSGVLTAQDQWSLVEGFLARCCQIAEAIHGSEDPFTVAFQHMYTSIMVANKRPAVKRVTHDQLRAAITSFQLAWGPKHPNTIVMRYHMAWDLLNGGEPEPARIALLELLPVAEAEMGRQNYTTTGIMRTLSRAYMNLKNVDESIRWMSDALERQQATLGADHPERMEGFRRLGEYYELVKNLPMAERSFETALEGQVRMLGAYNGQVMYTLQQYSAVLKKLNKLEKEARIQAWIDEKIEEEREMNPESNDWDQLQNF